ncbi:MAG TPA: gas vesicle protein GvpJ [Streptosporangiaceae bacterium]|nr:gas vesicle protein GvpJ [Streptosporangiaceae bacterium]
MTTAVRPAGGGPSSSGLADVIDTILDKGLVLDAYVRVSLVGIEVLTIDTRVVIASVDTYLRFAQAVNRLTMGDKKAGLPELVGDITEGGSRRKVKGAAQGAIEAAGDTLRQFLDEREAEPRRRRYREED